MLTRAAAEPRAVGRDDLRSEQVVGGQAVLAHEPSDAAAEGQPGDAGMADDAGRHREPEPLSRPVHIRPQAPGPGADRPCARIDLDGGHGRTAHAEPALAPRGAGPPVPPPAYRDGEVRVTRVADGRGNARRAVTARDDSGMPVDRPVPHPPRLLVPVVARGKGLAGEPRNVHQAYRRVACRRTD